MGLYIVKNTTLDIDNCQSAIYVNVVVEDKGMTWQEKIKQLMDSRGINQKQLSQLSGITESSVSRYLRSERRPRMDVVVNFAKALGVKTDYLLDDGEGTAETAYEAISTAIARKGGELTPEEKNKLIMLLLGRKTDV